MTGEPVSDNETSPFLRALLDEVKTIMDHNNNGSVFTAIETLFGLPSGQGQTVYDLCNGSMQAISIIL